MKTKSRKRLLVSSVAMLLVAMLALGTATYAWFTSSTTATANDIKAQTAKVSNLQISKYNHTWADTVTYGYDNSAMHPVSTATGSDWFTAAAASKNAFGANGDGFGAQTSAAGYWYAEELNVKNNGGAEVTNVKINIAVDTSADDFLRIALVPTSDEHVMTTGQFTTSVFDNAAVTYNAANASGPVTASNVAAITPKATTAGVSVGTLAAGSAKYYTLLVWFEGQDEQCYDVNATEIINDITFTITGDTGVGA